MPNDTTPNKDSSSVESGNDGGSLWKDLFDNKSGILLLGGGLFLILCNIIVFFGIDTRPNAWLFHVDMRYWSVYFSLFLWITALWLASESTDLVEDFLPFIRISAATCGLLVIIFALRSAFSIAGSDAHGHPFWLDVSIIVATLCVVRSLFLFYDYQYEGGESIDMEETQWFWGMSGFLFIGLLTLGIMYIIPVKSEIYAGMEGFVTESLLTSCLTGLQEMIQSGTGSMALRTFGLLIFVATIAFVYVAGKWALIFLSKIKERWE